MEQCQIAAQLFTIKDFVQTPKDIAISLAKIKKMGFDAVQVSALGPIEDKELAKILNGEGLTCCATHERGEVIIEEPEKVIEKLKILNCEYTAYPYPVCNPSTEEEFKQLAKSLDNSGKIMKKNGITLTYHNHAIEFQRFGNKTGLDIIYDVSSPENLQAEIDTYWVQYGGLNPVEWCQKMKNRLPLLHLKDYGMINRDITIFEVGFGNLKWKEIIAAAKKSGTVWYIIEQDVCRFDPFKSLEMSLSFLKENFC